MQTQARVQEGFATRSPFRSLLVDCTPWERRTRLRRAQRDRIRRAHKVLKHYDFSDPEPYDVGQTVVVSMINCGKSYAVRIGSGFESMPTCTCPDSSFLQEQGEPIWCKHIIAVLLKYPEWHCLSDILVDEPEMNPSHGQKPHFIG